MNLLICRLFFNVSRQERGGSVEKRKGGGSMESLRGRD